MVVLLGTAVIDFDVCTLNLFHVFQSAFFEKLVLSNRPVIAECAVQQG